MILVFPQASKSFNLLYRDIKLSLKGFENYAEKLVKPYNLESFSEILFIVLDSFAYKEELVQIFKKISPNTKINLFILQNETQGAMCTLLMATNKLKNKTVLISSIDQLLIDEDLKTNFEDDGADIQVPIFYSDKEMYSYLLRDEEKNPIQVFEKKVISNEAIMGFYYIKNFSDFFDESLILLEKYKGFRERTFYISDIINSFIRSKKAVSFPNSNSKNYHKLKQISELEALI